MTVGGALLGNVQGTLTGNVSGTLQGNSNTTVGISTLNNLTIAGIVTASQASITSIGIGTNPEDNRPLRINDAVDERIFVTSTGSIGIRTSEILPGVAINALTSNISLGGVGIGVTTFTAAVDLQSAGAPENRFVILPREVALLVYKILFQVQWFIIQQLIEFSSIMDPLGVIFNNGY